MSDYSFMRSGFDNLNHGNNELIENMSAIVTAFTENAINTAAKYVEHCGRNIITTEDIKRGLILEMYLFKARNNNIQHIEEIRRVLFEETLEEEEEEIVNDIEEHEDEFAESSCECLLCQEINNIYNKWINFQPSTRIEEILQRHINSIVF